MACATRKQKIVWLVGFPTQELPGNKLPSWGEVLRRYFKLHRDNNLDVRNAVTQVVREAVAIWEKARIPTAEERNIITKLERKVEEYRSILKGKTRRSAAQITKEEEFRSSLNNLFDIAHIDALQLIKIPEDREFLIAQQEPGRRGFMVGVDKVLAEKEERTHRRCELADERVDHQKQEQAAREETIELMSSSDSNAEANDTGTDQESTFGPSTPKRAYRTKNIVTPDLSAALDRTKTSDRSAVYVLSAAASALGHNSSELAISRSTIRRSRRIQRQAIAEDIQRYNTSSNSLVVHWDGKLLPDDGKGKVDRLPVIITDPRGTAKLLGVPSLPAGTGLATASAVVQCLEDWDMVHKVVGMSFDTTSSNTGLALGACTLLQQKLGRPLFHFACRHHILELVAEAAFTTCFAPSSGPDVAIFKRFQTNWNLIDQTKFDPMMPGDLDSMIANELFTRKEQVILFCSNKLESAQPRNDYREFLELVIILLGSSPQRGIRFIRPGAMHRARWMMRMIYAIKMYLFRNQFQLSAKELSGLKHFAAFTVTVYVKAWFTASSAIAAPAGDLAFLKELVSYPNAEIAKATSKKFANHLWYLSEEIAGLAIFDKSVPVEVKRMMVAAFKEAGQDNPQPRAQVDLSVKEAIIAKTVANFVSSASTRIFETFGVSINFLENDPTQWDDDSSFQSSQQVLSGISVVNDFAERGVALIQACNQILTKDEQQLQYLLQVVEWHRREFPDAKKIQHDATSIDN